MRRIGILTFHLSENQGSALQAYALKHTVKHLSPEDNVHIINYQPEGQTKIYDLVSNIRSPKDNLYNLIHAKSYKTRSRNFAEFVKTDLAPYPAEKIHEDKIRKICEEFDSIIVGSDQIWGYPNVLDSNLTYFLNFPGEFTRIAYAPSFGQISNFNSEEALRLIRKFKFLSVREQDQVSFLADYGINAKHVADPTLLLNTHEWQKLFDNVPLVKGKYIFYYSIGAHWTSFNFVRKLSKKTGLPVVYIGTYPKDLFSGFKKIRSAGPCDFLNLIYNASIVCSDSFHGTAFAVNFGKPLAAVFEEDENGQIIKECRKYSFLSSIGATKFICTPSTDLDTFISSIMHQESFPKLQAHIDESLSFLKNALSDETMMS